MGTISTRKTVDVAKVKAVANNYLSNDFLTPERKQGVIDLLDIILHETGNYAGFSYIDSYDANDPEFENGGRKNLRRKYF
jgi:hypothetical protein